LKHVRVVGLDRSIKQPNGVVGSQFVCMITEAAGGKMICGKAVCDDDAR